MKKNHTMKPTYQVSVISVIASITILLLLFVCSCSAGAGQQHQASAETPAQVMTIDTATTLTYKDYPGMLEGRVNVEIRPQVDGYL